MRCMGHPSAVVCAANHCATQKQELLLSWAVLQLLAAMLWAYKVFVML